MTRAASKFRAQALGLARSLLESAVPAGSTGRKLPASNRSHWNRRSVRHRSVRHRALLFEGLEGRDLLANFAPVDLTMAGGRVLENSAVGTEVGTLLALDPDEGDTFTYALVAGTGGADNGRFAIQGDKLVAQGPFDYELQNHFHVRLRAQDQGGLPIERSFTITIQDHDDLALSTTALVISQAEPENYVELGARVDPLNDQSVSADGRYYVYSALARNLVPNQVDRSANSDVFLYDRTDGSIRLVSHGVDSPESSADGESHNARVSADGSFVAFESTATNLIVGQGTSEQTQIYRYDVANGALTLVTAATTAPTSPSNGVAQLSGISADGSKIVFASTATNLITNQSDGNTGDDVFLYDRASNRSRLISHATTNNQTTGLNRSTGARLSGDGLWVVFTSLATNLAAGLSDSNGQDDIWLYNVANTQLTLVSHAAASGSTANAGSFAPSISSTGGVITFESAATNLVVGQADTNGARDVFVYVRPANDVLLASHAVGLPNTAANGTSTAAALSADGLYVAFQSTAHNLTPGLAISTTRTDEDVFVYSRSDGLTTLVSHASADPAIAGNGRSFQPSISDAGQYIAFLTQATDLIDGVTDANGGQADAIVYDLVADAAGIANRSSDSPFVTADAAADSVVINGGGDFAFFTSLGTNLMLPILDNLSTRDAFVYDVLSGSVDTVNRGDILAPATTSTGGGSSQLSAYAISDDHRYFVFTSTGVDLMSNTIGAPPNLGAGPQQVYVFDGITSGRTLVSHAANSLLNVSNGDSSVPLVSGDGRYVAFQSNATNLVASQTDTNLLSDVFLYDVNSGQVVLASRQNGAPTTAANGASRPIAISQDGQFILLASAATNLVAGQTDPNGGEDLFLFDRTTGTTILVSRAGASANMTASAPTSVATMSSDGQHIALASTATNLVAGAGDVPGTSDVYLFDVTSATMSLVSHSTAGATISANGSSSLPRIDPFGTSIAFLSNASNLVSGQLDSNNAADVFRYDMLANSLRLVSHSAANTLQTGNAAAQDVVVSADGTVVAYSSLATNLVNGQIDTNGAADVFWYDTVQNTATLVTRQLGSTTQTASGSVGGLAIGDSGRYVVYDTTATGLVALAPRGAGSREIYQYDSDTATTLLVTERPTESTTKVSRLTGLDASGEWLTFASDAELLVDWDFNFLGDFFVWSTSSETPNAAPTDISLSSTHVHEHLPVGTTVGTLGASDLDPGDTFVFSLVSGPGGDDNGSFQVNGGVLATNAIFNFDTQSMYQIRLRATDLGDAFVEKTLTITIIADNSPPTDIVLSREEVVENLRGATVGTITVVDRDVGDTHQLVVNDPRFTIAGDKLKLIDTQHLSRSTTTTVTLQLKATDSASNEFTKQFVLTVLANPTPWRNPVNGLDVNPDTFVAPQDALIVINELNAVGPYELPIPLEGAPLPPPYFDTNGDNFISPIDALLIINFLNEQALPEGEGEKADVAANGVTLDAPAVDATREASAASRPFASTVVATDAVLRTAWPKRLLGEQVTWEGLDDWEHLLNELARGRQG